MASRLGCHLIAHYTPSRTCLCLPRSFSRTTTAAASVTASRCVHFDASDPVRTALGRKYDINNSHSASPNAQGPSASFQESAFSDSFSGSTSATTPGYTHFGYSEIPAAEKEERVKNVFTNVAESYDLMNDAMSFGIHRLWKDRMVRRIAPRPNINLLDVAGGTGDIAFRVLRYALAQRQLNPRTHSGAAAVSGRSEKTLPLVTVCDINESMLRVGERRAATMDFHGHSSGPPTKSSSLSGADADSFFDLDRLLSWVVGDAEKLPFDDNSYDVYTIAFGIRNVTNIDQALAEAYRVLKPNGRFVCLEFSHVKSAVLEWLYDQYSFQVIPPLGLLLAQDWHSYQYLVESIRMFPTQDKFKEMIQQAGFKAVTYENMTNGLVAIHSGFKIS